VSILNIFTVALIIILFFLPACSDSGQVANTHSQSREENIPSATTLLDSPVLQSPENLKRNCEPKIADTRDSYRFEGLKVGTIAIDFTLKDTFGNEVTLSKLLGEKPVVLILGSFT
jgi:hypothetical protein